jgi:hypothetical protein
MTRIARAAQFIDTHARLLDRRRFALLFAGGDAAATLAALAAYANPDGGFGWGLEPDLRAPASQPVGALHAFEVLADVAPATSPLAGALCDWLDAATLADGGLPFAVAGAGGPGTAPWWAGADPSASSLHITSAVLAAAYRVAAVDATVAAHPWLGRATGFCRGAIAQLDGPPGAYELRYVLQLLDVLGDREGIERLGRLIPRSGSMAVAGGVEGEALRPLDFAPAPGRPLRRLFGEDVIAADLDRLERGQRDDGGWDVDFAPGSPAAALEWRGAATIGALRVLAANGRDIGEPLSEPSAA